MLKSIAITTLQIISFLFGSLPLLLFLFNKNKTVTNGVIFIYVLCSIISDFALIYGLYDEIGISGVKWLRTYTLLEVILFILYFLLVIKNKWIRIFILASLAVFLIPFFHTWNAPPSQAPFDSEPASTSAIICILFSLIYLYHAASDPQSAGKNFFNSRFWFAIGIMIYMAGNLFMFITYNNFKPEDAEKLATTIFALMTIVRNVFFSIGMWQKNE